MADRKNLTTTSYAILGWLAIQPWTTYELAKAMQRGLDFFWPRAASRLYEEPKKLVSLGLATRQRSFVGRRPRTVYSITDAGLEALREWHTMPSAPPSLDLDALVHVFLGETATPEQLLAAIESARRHAGEIFAQGNAVAEDYSRGTYAFPERAHYSGFVFDFLWPFAELLRDWADRSTAEIETWDDTAPSEAKRERAIAVMRDCIDRLQRYNERDDATLARSDQQK